MSEHNTQASNSRTEARRRLLRGGFSAAAVIPLAAGAQTAVASNMRCVANQATPVAPAMRLSGSRASTAAGGDGQVRVPLYKSTRSFSGTVHTRYWMKGADLIAIVGGKLTSVMPGVSSGSFVLSSSTRTTGVATPDVLGTIVPDATTYLQTGWSTPTQDASGSATRYVSVQFDANGIQVGSSDYKSTATANSALVQTCWSSFSGAVRPPTFT